MNIVVLSGGLSTERDVSITSGIMVAKALREKKHNVVLLDVYMGFDEDSCNVEELFKNGYDFTESLGVRESIPDLEKVKSSRKYKSASFLGKNVEEICRYADICFLALHGDIGENGKLQATLDLLGIKYTGCGSLGSTVAMNKGITKSILLHNKIGTPRGKVFNKNESFDRWSYFPCVVKPCSGGSSVGVAIVNSKEEFTKAMQDAFCYEDEVLVEQYVKGREFSVGVLDGKALPIIEIVPKDGFYDYVNKYQSGKTEEYCPAPLDEKTTEKIQKEAERAYKALYLEAYGRIDFLLDENGDTYCLEANTLPGMTPISLLPQEAKAAGMDFPELCEKIIELSLKKYKN